MARLVDRIATSLEPDMRAAFLQAVRAAVHYVPLDELEAAIRTKNTDLIRRLLERAVAERLLPELKPFYDILTAAMTAAGAAPVIGATLQFSLTDARVRSWIRANVGILVTGVANEALKASQQAVNRIVQAGYTEGFAPQVQARLIREVVGLTSRQETARSNYATSIAAPELAIPAERQVELVAVYTQRLLTQRANSIARTETFRATMAGRYELWGEQFARGALQSHRTWLKWIVVDDDRLCRFCRPMDGKKVRYGEGFRPTEVGGVEPVYRTRKPDPYSQKRDLQGRFAKSAEIRPITDGEVVRFKSQWQTDQVSADGWLKFPPLHIQCLPAGMLVSPGGRVTGASERQFDGDLVIIRTASNQYLSCTPNHPVLTPNGWVPAYLLQVGDNVVRTLGLEGIAGLDSDDHNMPTLIEEVAEPFLNDRQVPSIPVPVTAEDFHGDGKGSKVAVVGSDRFLMDGVHTPFAEESSQLNLIGAGVLDPVLLNRGGSFDFALDARDHTLGCPVGGGDLSSSLVGSHPTPLDEFGFPLASSFDASFEQSFLDGSPVDPQLFGELVLRHPGQVAADEVVYVERYPFHGPVYNIETTSGWYSAGSIVVHNCRCDLVLVFER